MMDVYSACLKRRAIRSFKRKKIPFSVLRKCVNAARLAPSSRNLQPLEFIVADSEKICRKVFSCLLWAADVKWKPSKKEMPAAYIVILVNTKIKKQEKAKHDAGIAASVVSLVAFSFGVSSCILGSFSQKLNRILKIPKNYEIDLVVALGYVNQESKVEKFKGSTKYWFNGKFHVPKRSLKDVLHRNEF